jgi:hypothetical protein
MLSWGNVQSTVKVRFPVALVENEGRKQRKFTSIPWHDPLLITVVTGAGVGVGVTVLPPVGPLLPHP